MKYFVLPLFSLLTAATPFSQETQSMETYTLKNKTGMEVALTNYGAAVTSLRVPDKGGHFDDVVLGYDTPAEYAQGHSYFGCVVGRYANRIAKGKFTLNGKEYTLAVNNAPNSLHGGKEGFDKVLWKASAQEGNRIVFSYLSKAGEEGYPGTLTTKVTYRLTEANELEIRYEAAADQATVVNLTNHSYFNLAGQGRGDILGHLLTLYAGAFTPVDANLIPTGEIRKVAGTPFDFIAPHAIGERVNAKDEQLIFGKGYDHNFVLNGAPGVLRTAAKVVEPTSGRVMEVFTTEPGVQFYCGNFLDGTEKGKGSVYTHRSGFCLETQHFPDSPNHPVFPSTVLKPGVTFRSETVYRFSIVQNVVKE